MDQPSQTNANEGAANGNTPASSYGLTTFYQPLASESSVPPSSAAATVLPAPASQGAVSYPATILAPLMNQQPSQANTIEGATSDGDTTPAAYALATYHHQPEALASVPPSSSSTGATFLAVPASQGGGAGAYPSGIPPPLSNPYQIAFQQLQQQHHQQQQQQNELVQRLQVFWAGQLAEAEQTTELKVHNLPLARIKKIMKADEDVKMIAAEAPVIFAKACEMFILELTLRAWHQTEGTKRRTLQGSDVAAAVIANEMFDFLTDIVPVEERSGDGVHPPHSSAMPVMPPSYGPGPAMSVPFPIYVNQQHVSFMWPPSEYQQQQQQNSDGGREE